MDDTLEIGSKPPVAHERADAARNRARILAAAEALFAAGDPDQVTMEDVAVEAGVGRATLYRRYPDPASIATALLNEHERAIQQELLSGEPPLGPGAPAADRLAAFYDAMIDLLVRHSHLVLGAESGHSRLTTEAYGFWRAHVRALVTDSGRDDPDVLVDILLAPLAPEVFRYQQDQLGIEANSVKHTLTDLAYALLA